MPVTRPLPDSPDLDQLKRQAKDLLRAARDSDPAALALHDAQSVIAREHGFAS